MSTLSWLVKSLLLFGLVFLYLPMGVLIFYSFNDGRLVTVWTGFSLRWYAHLLENTLLLNAAWLSLKVAFVSATLATILGLMAAYALTRSTKFNGRSLLEWSALAPLVLPDVMIGLALLLFFVALGQWIGWPAQRGTATIILAHTTLGLAYVLVVVRVRLQDFDQNLVEAAQDLGATPLRTFMSITLPLIQPGLVAGWLLAFSLSLDDLVIASFVSGPGSTTLPMYLYSQIRLGVTPEINALSTLMIVVVIINLLVAFRLIKGRS